jgi:prolyl 4-hydroxylase
MDHDALGVKLAELLPGDESGSEPRVYTGFGKKVSTSDELNDGQTVHLVAPWRQFVWPTFEVGHRVNISGIHETREIYVETMETTPRVFQIHGFMSEEECDGLINNAQSIKDPKNRMKRSGVGAQQDGVRDDGESGGKMENIRTSQNAWDTTSPLADMLVKRAFKLLGVPYDSTLKDGLQLLHYDTGNAYIHHHDYFPKTSASEITPKHNWDPKRNGSNRLATVFLYLNTPEKGGQTVFPTLDSEYCDKTKNANECTFEGEHELVDIKLGSRIQGNLNKDNSTWETKMSKQCESRFSVQPKKGSAIFFYSQHPDGEMDYQSLHGGCPVIVGEKWSANLWVWNAPRYRLALNELMVKEGYAYKAAGKKDDPSRSITIKNVLGKDLEMYWINTLKGKEGQETLSLDLPTGASKTLGSFVGHQFKAKVKGTGEFVQKITIGKRELFYTIDGRRVGAGERQLKAGLKGAGAEVKGVAAKRVAAKKGVAATVVNGLDVSKVDVAVFWVEPASGKEVQTGSVPWGKQMQVNSFKNHQFRFRQGGPSGLLMMEYTMSGEATQTIVIPEAAAAVVAATAGQGGTPPGVGGDTESESEL